ncbi:MAG: DUF2079 domain-containing protein [Candidatus Coatesbacteria bacterium]|nr:DUF2079 domain-containing protein [Candidatus Coatesbacteria bacterium]
MRQIDRVGLMISGLAGAVIGAYFAWFFPGVCAGMPSPWRTLLFALAGAILTSALCRFSARPAAPHSREGIGGDVGLTLIPAFALITIPLFMPHFGASKRAYFSSYIDNLGPKAFLFGLILAAGLFIRIELDSDRRARIDQLIERNRIRILAGIVALYIAFFLATGLWDFYIFGNWHDLSRFTTAQYSFSQGHFFLSRLHTQSGGQTYELIGDHFAPTKLIVLPFFLIFRTAAVFLVIKTLIMGLAAVPFFALVRTRLKALESLLLTVAYLLIPTAIAQNYTGFHPIIFATLLMPASIYFFERGRFGWFMTFMVLSSGLKENVPFIMLMFPVLALLQRRARKWIIAPAVVNILWIVLVFAILFPNFRAADNMMVVRYPYIRSISGLAMETLRNPSILLDNLSQVAKQELAFYMFAPFFFLLPFGSLYSLMGLAPAFVVCGLMNWEVPITFHHGILPSSCFAPATAVTIARIGGGGRRMLSLSLAVLAFVIAVIYTPVWWGAFKMKKDPYFDAQKAALEMVPSHVPATAPRYMLPHLASRNEVYFLGENALAPGAVQYAIVDVAKITTWWETPIVETVKNTSSLDGFDLIYQEGPIYVFHRKGVSPE